ncbi:MarR family winged helix-turn-helix transcriptional regulator [Subtercola endophyticus]|uniref:MarR family winged helix-turn-helix transcriptional regulator n=1 Tax=Subtercola endophyticus TaxID=2895559 RepID=UPI001E589F24|nr:MarR family transcriptional regulator [Subtercola endophyticus]UFS59416.1 MarR family transcriptional regulator [Subtercola endophyticus]
MPAPVTSPTVDALVQLSFAVHLALTRIAGQFDLSVTQLRLLGILRDRTPSMAAIADFLELDRSSISGLVDRAERRGLVARRASTVDARVILVEATPEGLAVGAQIAQGVSSALEQLIGDATPADIDAVVRLAASLQARADRDMT